MDQQNKLKDSLLRFFHDLFDLMVVNWLWLLCCLPVVTIGPATCALYTVTLKLAREESAHPIREFFRGLRENFKAGLVLGIIVLALAAVAAGDVYFALTQTGLLRSMYLVIGMVLASVLMTITAYGFALQARFDSPLKVHLANAFRLAFVAPGKTLALWGILLLPVLFYLLLPPVAVGYLGFLYIMVGFSGPVYLAARIQRQVFDKVTGTTEPET